jgi:hypothetical protein
LFRLNLRRDIGALALIKIGSEAAFAATLTAIFPCPTAACSSGSALSRMIAARDGRGVL